MELTGVRLPEREEELNHKTVKLGEGAFLSGPGTTAVVLNIRFCCCVPGTPDLFFIFDLKTDV